MLENAPQVGQNAYTSKGTDSVAEDSEDESVPKQCRSQQQLVVPPCLAV